MKSATERARAYRERKRAAANNSKTPVQTAMKSAAKNATERSREYRAREKRLLAGYVNLRESNVDEMQHLVAAATSRSSRTVRDRDDRSACVGDDKLRLSEQSENVSSFNSRDCDGKIHFYRGVTHTYERHTIEKLNRQQLLVRSDLEEEDASSFQRELRLEMVGTINTEHPVVKVEIGEHSPCPQSASWLHPVVKIENRDENVASLVSEITVDEDFDPAKVKTEVDDENNSSSAPKYIRDESGPEWPVKVEIVEDETRTSSGSCDTVPTKAIPKMDANIRTYTRKRPMPKTTAERTRAYRERLRAAANNINILMETPIETPVETPLETPMETPLETPIETPMETPVETPLETPMETPLETPLETLVKARAKPPAKSSTERTREYRARKKRLQASDVNLTELNADCNILLPQRQVYPVARHYHQCKTAKAKLVTHTDSHDGEVEADVIEELNRRQLILRSELEEEDAPCLQRELRLVVVGTINSEHPIVKIEVDEDSSCPQSTSWMHSGDENNSRFAPELVHDRSAPQRPVKVGIVELRTKAMPQFDASIRTYSIRTYTRKRQKPHANGPTPTSQQDPST